VDDFLELSPELQAFVSKPINRPYLELAQRLSEMSVDKLRSVGEGNLEVTRLPPHNSTGGELCIMNEVAKWMIR
jgi:hypothetical protein